MALPDQGSSSPTDSCLYKQVAKEGQLWLKKEVGNISLKRRIKSHLCESLI